MRVDRQKGHNQAINRDKSYDKWYLERYGITLTEKWKLFHLQENRCALCRRTPSELLKVYRKNRYLSIDHDHTSGEVRGILCSSCNQTIALWESKPNKHILKFKIRLVEKIKNYILNSPAKQHGYNRIGKKVVLYENTK